MICLSLKWRVSLWVSTLLVVVIATVSAVAYFEFEESHLREIDGTLLAMANGISATLDGHQGQGKLEEEVRAVTATSGPNALPFPYRIWIEGSSADLLASDTPDSEYGRWLRGLPEQNAPAQEQHVLMDIGRRGNEYRAVWMRHRIDEDLVNIVVAGCGHFTYHELHEFLRLLLVLGASLILGSVVAITWIVRRGLRPIHTTAEQLQGIAHPNVREPILDEKEVPEELRPFVRALTEMLGRLNRVLQQQEQFTSDAAHELRTPLAGAKSVLQASQMQQREPDEYRNAIRDALEDISRMERLIEQLLVLARMDEANGQGVTQEIQLDLLLSELTEAYNDKAQRSGGRVILAESSTVTVRGDLDELVRLFSNVLDNAVRYGPPGGTIGITLKCEPNSCATICVRDEGGSIPPAALPHLFDRFYRVDECRSNSTGGAGLGLAIAWKIVSRHDGDISITSDVRSGTLVRIRLPRA